jgi:hypothetical protein
VRRRIAYIAAIMASGAFAALPGAVASGDSSGGTAAPSDPPAQAPPQDPSAQAPVASPGKPALSPPGAAVVGQWITLSGLVASEDAGSAVAVQQQTPTGDWADVGTATSGRDGSFSVRWRPMTVGRIALRALIADTSGARAADAASEVEVTVFIANVIVRPDGDELRRLAASLADGRLRIDIDASYPLTRAAEALAHATKGAHGSVVLEP